MFGLGCLDSKSLENSTVEKERIHVVRNNSFLKTVSLFFFFVDCLSLRNWFNWLGCLKQLNKLWKHLTKKRIVNVALLHGQYTRILKRHEDSPLTDN